MRNSRVALHALPKAADPMTQQSLHILVIEDNALLARNLADYLEQQGHVADFAADGRQGLQLALENLYDVVVLDLMLPKMDGWQVCVQLRAEATRHVPLLMLTARDTLHDKLQGFALGADDYLTKPFALQELLARCQVLARRHRLHQERVLSIGSMTIDRTAQTVMRDRQPVSLHQIGYRIVLALAEAHPRVLTRSELTQHIWGDEPPDSDALRSHLYRLRQSLDKPFPRPMLVTVHGVGFRLDATA